jgi:type IV pilus assembly protein PilM
MLAPKKKTPAVVGLDFETGSIAATEVRGNGERAVGRTAIAPLPPGVVTDGEVRDTEQLAGALRELFAHHKLSKSVRLGIANQRVVVRTILLPLIEDPEELDTAVRFRAQDEIPMPLDQAVLDHRVLAKRNGPEGDRQMEVLAVAARRDMVITLLEALRKAGLSPVGIDLSAFGMIRALPSGSPAIGESAGATLFCHLGDVTNLAVSRDAECIFTRVAPYGIEDMAERLSERDVDMSMDEARDRLLEVGLEEELDLFEEDGGTSAATAREVLTEGAGKLVDELRMSLDYYGAREGVPPIERVVICGLGSTVPGLPERIEQGLGLGIVAESPKALSHLDPEDAARLTVSYGLALEE